MTGCVSYTVTGPIGAPLHPAAVTSPRTAQLNQYVSTAGYFKQVTEYPVRLGEQDVSLKFNMTSLKGHRGIHPGYVPGALLTLTVWIWVNGPIYVDTFDVAGDLVIVDRDGK